MIDIRYSLIPYLYSEFLKAYSNDELMFKPLSFEFGKDEVACQIDDQLLLGNELMIAPIYKQNASGRHVYLPEDMVLIRMRKSDDFDTELLSKGHHYVKANLNELIFFIRKNKAIPMYVGKKVNSTSDYAFVGSKEAYVYNDNLKLLGFADASYELWSDDGISSDLSKTIKIVIT